MEMSRCDAKPLSGPVRDLQITNIINFFGYGLDSLASNLFKLCSMPIKNPTHLKRRRVAIARRALGRLRLKKTRTLHFQFGQKQ